MSGGSLGTDTTVGGWRRVEEKTETLRRKEDMPECSSDWSGVAQGTEGVWGGVGWGGGLGSPFTALKG